MFDKIKFAKILGDINNTYDTMTEFAQKSGVNRTYLSQYINQKLDAPPTPKILIKIAENSHGIITYDNLMQICGYVYRDVYLSTVYVFENITSSLKTAPKIKQLLNNFNYFCSYSIKAYSEFLNFAFYREEKTIKNFTDQSFYSEFLQLHDLLATNLIQENIIDYQTFHHKESLDYLNNDKKSLLLPGNTKYDFIDFNDRSIKKMETITNKLLTDLSNLYKNQYSNYNKDNFNNELHNTYYNIPVYGQISAGLPNWAEECLEGYLPIDPNMMNIVNPEDCFFLRVNGESMNKVIRNGAYALIRKQDIVENGEIAAVLVNGDSATIKKFTQHGEVVVLEPMSDNPNFQTQIYDKNTTIKILGKYIGKFEINN